MNSVCELVKILVTVECAVQHGGCVFISVSLFVCLFVGLFKNYSASLHKIWWKGGTLDFNGNWDHVT